MRGDAVSIFHAGLRAADPAEAIRRHLELEGDRLLVQDASYALGTVERIVVVGMGKAAAAMAEPLVGVLGDRIHGGHIIVKYGHGRPLQGIAVAEAGHPVPDSAGVRATAELIRLLEGTGPRDLVLCVISGGGSALCVAPANGVTLEEKQQVTERLLECGAAIHEINAVRKHLSRIKGGQMARMAFPSHVVALILSDVIGDDLDTIASGPTAADRSTYQDCLRVLERYEIRDEIPRPVIAHLQLGADGRIPETPKSDDPALTRTQNVIVGSNALAIAAAKKEAEALGYNALILSSFIKGETREVAQVHAAIAREILATGNPVARPACIISGGETTVTLRGSGKGGRNQEFVLAAAAEISDLDGVVVLSAGTDGSDGPTDAAGAVADGGTVARARATGLDVAGHLANNDSYRLFDALGDLIRTGPTLTNVMDLRLVMVE